MCSKFGPYGSNDSDPASGLQDSSHSPTGLNMFQEPSLVLIQSWIFLCWWIVSSYLIAKSSIQRGLTDYHRCKSLGLGSPLFYGSAPRNMFSLRRDCEQQFSGIHVDFPVTNILLENISATLCLGPDTTTAKVRIREAHNPGSFIRN